MSDVKDTEFFNPHEGLTKRDGGPYLDDVERLNAEARRAKVEDREPDFENATFVAGTPAVTKRVLEAAATNLGNPSKVERGEAKNEDSEPLETLPVSQGTKYDEEKEMKKLRDAQDKSTATPTVEKVLPTPEISSQSASVESTNTPPADAPAKPLTAAPTQGNAPTQSAPAKPADKPADKPK